MRVAGADGGAGVGGRPVEVGTEPAHHDLHFEEDWDEALRDPSVVLVASGTRPGRRGSWG
ncbi:MAG: hypothetical protein ACRDZQ_14740 [Acidimicrobiales bacterium]